jgi:hypothetical protein
MCIRSRIGLIGSGSGTAEFCNGGEVAGAGFVPKSVAEDNGAFILDNSESGDVTRHDFQKRARKSAFLVNSPVGGKNTLDGGAGWRAAAFDVSGLCPIEGSAIVRI